MTGKILNLINLRRGFFRFLTPIIVIFLIIDARAQDESLFDDTRVSSVYIEISPDSLALIMTDVLSDHYFMARFIFDDSQRRDTVDSIGFRLRGNTSRYAKKKSFKVSFNEYVQGRRYQGVKKLNLNGQHNDPTMIREKLFYDVWKRSGMVERRTSFVKLFINSVYYGLYTNVEEFDKDWLERVFPDKSGNLYKCTYPADLVYYGKNQDIYKEIQSSTVTGGRAYDLQTNESQDDYTGFVDLLEALHQPADSFFTANLQQYLDVDHYLKAFALDVATGNWDDYAYNKNNFFLYDRPDNSKFEFITYDADNTFGVDWVGKDWATRNCLSWPNPLLNVPLAQKTMLIPSLVSKYKLYLDTIVHSVLDPGFIFPRIDSLKALIYEAAVADTYRCLDFGYTVAAFNNGFITSVDWHTPYGIKPFITKRRQKIIDQLHPTGTGNHLSATVQVMINPNPVNDHMFIRCNGLNHELTSLEIVDITGKTLLRQPADVSQDGIIQVNTSELPAGLFMVRLTSEGMVITGKFLKL
jgi:hypothetical protein